MKNKPQLDNLAKCQNLVNNNYLELRKFFDVEIRKDWDFGRHLLVKRTHNGNTVANYVYITANPVDRLINSNHAPEAIKPDTYIVGPDNNNSLVIFQWKHKLESQYPDSGKRIILIEQIRTTPYVWDKSLSKLWADTYKGNLAEFLKDNLVTQCLDKSRAKGNQNSKAQSKRAKHPRTSQYQVNLEFINPKAPGSGIVSESKSMLEAYKIAVTYGYDRNYKYFQRALKAGKAIIVDYTGGTPIVGKNGKRYIKKDDCALYCSLVNPVLFNSNLAKPVVFTQPVNSNTINTTLNKDTLNLNENFLLDGLCKHNLEPAAQNTITKKDEQPETLSRAEILANDRLLYNVNTSEQYKDWYNHCTEKKWDAEMCWTWEEWQNKEN